MPDPLIQLHLLETAIFDASFSAPSKYQALRQIVERLCPAPGCGYDTRQIILNSLLAREKSRSTGIGNSVAIPHAILRPGILPFSKAGFFRSPDGIPFDSADSLPVRVIACTVAQDESHAVLIAASCEVVLHKSSGYALSQAQSPSKMRAVVEQALARIKSSSVAPPSVGPRCSAKVTVRIRGDLHARPSIRFIELAHQFVSSVHIHATGLWVNCDRDEAEADGKSLMQMMVLGAGEGTILEITTEGPDAPEALAALVDLVNDNFGG